MLFPKLTAYDPEIKNCLLTNGKGLEDQDEYCILYKIKQVVRFDIDKTFSVIG